MISRTICRQYFNVKVRKETPLPSADRPWEGVGAGRVTAHGSRFVSAGRVSGPRTVSAPLPFPGLSLPCQTTPGLEPRNHTGVSVSRLNCCPRPLPRSLLRSRSCPWTCCQPPVSLAWGFPRQLSSLTLTTSAGICQCDMPRVTAGPLAPLPVIPARGSMKPLHCVW